MDVGGFWLLHRLGLAVLVAAILSFLIAAVVNYVLTSLLVFRHPLDVRRAIAYFVYATIGFSANVAPTTVLWGHFNVAPELAKLSGIALAFGLNFAINYAVVFRVHSTRGPTS